MKYPKRITHKLFYRKWSYKIKCHCKGSWMIKRLGLVKAIRECLHRKQTGSTAHTYASSYSNYDPDRLLAFINDVDPFLDKDIHVRTEGSIFSIYCSDSALFESMCKKLDYWILEVFEPASDAEYQFMLDNGHKKVLCNHLPYNLYKYRVYIKEKINIDTREKLWAWMSKYNGKMRASNRVEVWLRGEKAWAMSPNIYVQDAPTLSMFLMFLGDRVSRVEEFIPRSVINTLSEEQSCQV